MRRRAMTARGPHGVWSVRTLLLALVWAALAAAAILFVPPFLRRTELLEIRRVEIRGNRLEPREELLACVEGLLGENLLTAPYEQAAHRLRARARVRDARWMRRPPHQVVFVVEERVGKALVFNGTFCEIDAEGILLPPAAEGLVPDLPILSGVSCQGLVPGNRIESEAVPKALAVLDLLRAAGFDTARLLSEIRIDGQEISLVWQEEGGALVLLGEGGYQEKISRYRNAYSFLARDGAFPRRVDLRFERQIVVSYGS